ncbi:hypothetical protein BRARA_I03653 [Brassica rapa]|uniref:Uncharacterized protein n=2 Tax=Brassica campestris TaxID=3711 RepID=A0A397Y064_BRACM|nr:hypothetical protein IGI04_037484 [Brassica rapa subsp. trilocularis]RID47022.1 hypothetical protein BRARA_I03653 [Brassica rapa]
MSSVCGGLDYKDAESHISASSPNKCSNNGSNHVSVTGSEDAQESDGDDSGNIHQYLNEESKDITEPVITEPLLPLKSSDDEGEDKDLAKNMLSVSPQVSAAIVIPAIKGSREKHGKSVEKLSVSWAEDVYDPPPSIVSHTRSKKQQQHQKSKSSLKKSGKKGHKGSSSSSSSSSSRGSKDKKSSSSSSSRSKHSRDKFGWATQMPIAAASS